jgi:hypothetical protein
VQGAGEQRSHEFYLSKEEVVCPTWRDLKHQSNPESQTECIRSTVGVTSSVTTCCCFQQDIFLFYDFRYMHVCTPNI